MSRLIATRISDEQYSKIMGKCSGLGCSVYDYLKMLVETDIAHAEKATHVDEKKKQADREFSEKFERIKQKIQAIPIGDESNSVRT
jgi:negative regulator of replication initiation